MIAKCPDTPQAWRRLFSDHVLSQPEKAPAGLRASSVLVPVVIDAEQPYLILTKRTAHLPNHAGQICFPRRQDGSGGNSYDHCLERKSRRNRT